MNRREKKDRDSAFYRASARLGRGLLYTFLTCLYRPALIYTDNNKSVKAHDGPVIYVANHTCHNDGQMMLTLFRGSALLMARDWMEKGMVRWITSGSNCIPIDRFGLDTAWLRAASEKLRSGTDVVIFPEGHTSKTGEIDEFKSGFVMLAVLAGVPVVPVYIDGEYHRCFGRRLRVYVGEPYELSTDGRGMNAEYLTKESARYRDMIIRIKGGFEK